MADSQRNAEPAAPRRRRGMLTIDGPAGTGKSATARAVAAELGLLYLDSGALYRALAVAAARAGLGEVTRHDDPRLAQIARNADLQPVADTRDFRILLDGADLDPEIRSEAISQLASRLAIVPVIRERVGRLLRGLAAEHDCIAEGRDMGSTVFPDADLKIYLTATLAARVARRCAQLRERGEDVDEARVRGEMEARDDRDRTRTASPLQRPPGALRLDTTRLTLAEQVAIIVSLYRGRGRIRPTRFYKVCYTLVRFAFLRILGVRVAGSAKLPLGAFVLASNHQSLIDPPLVGTMTPGMIAFLAKEELFRGLLGVVIRRLNAIPVRRGQADREALRRSLDQLQRMVPLLVFPEGTRVRRPGLERTHTGVAWLARRARVPVVPVSVSGGGIGRSILRLRRLRVVFGEPLRYPEAAVGAGADRAFTDEVMAAIRKLGGPACGDAVRT